MKTMEGKSKSSRRAFLDRFDAFLFRLESLVNRWVIAKINKHTLTIGCRLLQNKTITIASHGSSVILFLANVYFKDRISG